MTTMPTRASWWLAAAGGTSAAAVAFAEARVAWLAVLAAVAIAAAVWVTTRTPWPGVALTIAAVLGLGRLGLRTDSSAAVAIGCVIVVVTLGYLLPWQRALAAAAALWVATMAVGAWRDVPSWVFGGALMGLAWGFGAAVRSRDQARRRAAAEAAGLARVDPAERGRVAAVAAIESHTASALAIVGSGVERMTGVAAVARDTLQRSSIEEVRDLGKAVTNDLRALLLVLREDPSTSDPDTAATPDHAGSSVMPVVRTVLPALLPVLVWALTEELAPYEPRFAVRLLLVVLAAGCVLIRPRWPAGGTVALLLVGLVGVATGVVDVSRDTQWYDVAAMAVAWTAGAVGTRRAIAAWATLAIWVVGVVATYDRANVVITLIFLVLPYLAGAAWSGQHLAESAHHEQVRVRRAAIAAAEERAAAEARLALARDLHDAASHAVGTMMMQANAALVVRERDPAAARAALDTAVAVGSQATLSLGREAAGSTTSLDQELEPLVAAAALAGSQVSCELAGGLARSDQDLVVRVAREGLANPVRHAPASGVRVEVARTLDVVIVRIVNGPSAARESSPGGTGQGVLGLGELVGARGGSVSARPGVDGGWLLEARWPAFAQGPARRAEVATA